VFRETFVCGTDTHCLHDPAPAAHTWSDTVVVSLERRLVISPVFEVSKNAISICTTLIGACQRL